MFEYQVMYWQEHNVARVLKRLNEWGAENWQPAFVIGNTIILCRTIADGKIKSAMNVHITGGKNE